MRSGLGRFLSVALILTVALAAGSVVVLAQDDRAMKATCQAGVEQFEAAAPAIGEPLPDVPLIDARGRVHRLRDLAGENYTVLVLGCLT